MLQFGIPHGSVLGLRIFIQYAQDVDELFNQHGLLLTTCKTTAVAGLDCPLMVKRLERCITNVSAWCASKRLQLNSDKTASLVRLCDASLPSFTDQVHNC